MKIALSSIFGLMILLSSCTGLADSSISPEEHYEIYVERFPNAPILLADDDLTQHIQDITPYTQDGSDVVTSTSALYVMAADMTSSRVCFEDVGTGKCQPPVGQTSRIIAQVGELQVVQFSGNDQAGFSSQLGQGLEASGWRTFSDFDE